MRKAGFFSFAIGLVFASALAFAQTQTASFPQISISGAELLRAGKEQQLVLHIYKNASSPMTPDDLKTVHTEKIHLLAVDDSMTDYQHIHPVAGKTPGEYLFSFTPKTSHDYKLWADISPVAAPHEYLLAALKGEAPCKTSCIDQKPSLQGSAGGLKAVLSFDADKLTSGTAAMGMIDMDDAEGNPVKNLQPVMGAFAHIVGFYTAQSAVVHVHPMGEEPKDDQARGGPELMFHLEPEYAGAIKLFVQVRQHGRDIFIPFTLNVQ